MTLSQLNETLMCFDQQNWIAAHKTIQFASESFLALLIIAKAWWQWWDLATNVSESVWQFQWLSLLLCISFNFWIMFWGSFVFARRENVSHFETRKYIIHIQPSGSEWTQRLIIFHCSYPCFQTTSPLLAGMILEIFPGTCFIPTCNKDMLHC